MNVYDILIGVAQILFLLARINILVKPSYVPRGSSIVEIIGYVILAASFHAFEMLFAVAMSVLSCVFWSLIFMFRGKNNNVERM